MADAYDISGSRVIEIFREGGGTMPDYGDYVFIYDKEGNEYACPMKSLKGQVKKVDKLTEEEKKKCMNMGEVSDVFSTGG
jgi:hypothetical protein